MSNSKEKYIQEEFNLFRIIELLIKRKFLFFSISILCMVLGFLYSNNLPQNINHIAQIKIEEGSNWEKDFVKNLKVLVIYDTFTVESDPETKIDINNVDVSLNEYMTYRYYDFKGYQDSVINVSSRNLYGQFGSLVNNQVIFSEVVKNSSVYSDLKKDEKDEIDRTLNNFVIKFEKNPFDNLYKIIIDVKNVSTDYEKNKKNLEIILNAALNYLKNRIITQLNILLTTYISNQEKDFYSNKEQQNQLFDIVRFQLNTHLEIAKKFNIKRNLDIELNENGRDYYLKGYELIQTEIAVLEQEIKRNAKIKFNLNNDVFISYLNNDIKIMENNVGNFDIIKYQLKQYSDYTFNNKLIIILLSLAIGIFLSIIIILTIENYLIYKTNKLIK